MTLTAGRLLRAAWDRFRREHRLLVAVAAPFLFLPSLVVQLLADPVPLPFEATQQWQDKAAAWAEANLHWYLLAELVGIYGMAVLALLIAHPQRPTTAQALARGLTMLPRFLLAALLVQLPIGLGLYLLILPGLYMQARLLMVPLLIASEPVSAVAAAGWSWRLTGREAWPLAGAVIGLFAIQWLGAMLLLPADQWLREPAHANPFVLALVDATYAALTGGYKLGLLLLAAASLPRVSKGT